MDEVRRETTTRAEREKTINTTAMETIQGENEWVGETKKERQT